MHISKITAQFIVDGKTITVEIALRDGYQAFPVPTCVLTQNGDRHSAVSVKTEHTR